MGGLTYWLCPFWTILRVSYFGIGIVIQGVEE